MRTLKLTHPPTVSNDVKVLQRALKNNPWKKNFKAGGIDGAYGPATAGAVKRAKYFLGYPNGKCTGDIAGDLFYSLLMQTADLPPSFKLRRKLRARKTKQSGLQLDVIKIARSKLGVVEKPAGSNIVEFSTWYGLIGPWCAMFVTWCYVSAGSKIFKRGKQWSYVPYILNEARKPGTGLTIIGDPSRGDVVIYDWGHDGVMDHVGLFLKWTNKSAGEFEAIEGNTGLGNDSNGGEVMRRARQKRDVAAFIRVHG